MALSSERESALKRIKDLENLLDLAPDLIFRVDRKLRYIFVNRRVTDVTGLSREHYLGKTNRELQMPEELCDLWDNTYRSVFRDRQPQEIEFAYRTPGGRRHYQMRVVPEEAPDGSIVTTVGITRDITEQKRVEEALRGANAQIHTVLESITDGFMTLDRTWHFTYFNEIGARAIGMNSGDLLGKCVWDLFPHATSSKFYSEFHRALETRKPSHFEEFYPEPINRWLECHCFPSPERLSVYMRDITARKRAEEALTESEQRLRTVLENSQDGINMLDLATGRYVFLSPAQVEMTGFTFEEMRGITAEETDARVHPDDRETSISQQKRVTAGADSGESVEYRWKVKSGEYRWFSDRRKLVRDEQGRPIALVGVSRDITERKRAEKALRQLNETLEQRVAERTQLAEARARQLQAMAVELIEAEERERRRVSDLLHEDLQQILAGARMQLQAAIQTLPATPLLTNVERLLEESIERSRYLSYELSPAVLYQLGLVAVLKWLARHMRERFQLHVELEADSGEQIENSSLKVFIFRAVQELLFNVAKHAGVKNARVVISGAGSSLVVTVSDEGRGFNPNNLKSDGLTAGLGLPSLRERASYIGGSMVIESAPGRGSRIVLTVPLSLAKTDNLLQPSADRQTRTLPELPAFTDAGAIRVLFADDHKVIRQGLISMLFGQPDIEVVGEASNGREALERVREVKPDLVVMDISMPEMNGVEATRRIKAEFPEIRVIGLSMYEDEQLARTMRLAGAEAFVSKTASSSELLKAIYGMKENSEK